MNLVEADILTSPIFLPLPRFQSVVYKGMVSEKVRFFEAELDGEKRAVFSLMFVRAEEKFFWESCSDLLNRAMEQASASVAGIFTFDLLSFAVHQELKTFSDLELARLIVNHARKLAPGQERLIKYSSCYGLLRKLSQEDWGKVTLKAAVEVFVKEPEELDTLVKKVLTATGKQPGPRAIVLHDLSQEPVLQPQDVAQKTRLAKVLGQQQNLFVAVPEVFICDKNGVQGAIGG